MREFWIVADYLEAEGYKEGAGFLRKAVDIGMREDIFPESLELTILEPSIVYSLKKPEKNPVYNHPLFDYDRRNGEIDMKNGRITKLLSR